jgi:hypothetical protein
MKEQQTKKVKGDALHFIDPDASVNVFADEGEKKKLSMVSYSGGIIQNHWYWGNVAFDLKGMKIPKGSTPILEEHSLARKIGIAHKYSIKDNKLEIVDASFVTTPESEEFQKLSVEGFPYQCSIRGLPKRIEEVTEGSSTEVNGFKLKGPGHVWREWELKESSVCVFGADSNTSAKAFKEEAEITFFVETVEKNKEDKGEIKMFDIEKFKMEEPDAFAEIQKGIQEKITRDLEDKFAIEKADLLKQINELKENSTKMTDEQQVRLEKLERELKVSRQKELRFEAERIFETEFAVSELPEEFKVKIKRLVPYTQFASEDVLDVDKFKEALVAEFKDWKGLVTEEVKIKGTGSYQREPAKSAFTEEDAEAEADKIFSLVK